MQHETPNLRATNFKMGHDKLNYHTTTADNTPQVQVGGEDCERGLQQMADRKKA